MLLLWTRRGSLRRRRRDRGWHVRRAAILDRRRGRSSSPHAVLRFVTEKVTIVAPQSLTAHRCPVPSFMAMIASPIGPSRRRRTGLQCWRSESRVVQVVSRLDILPRHLLMPPDHSSRGRQLGPGAPCGFLGDELFDYDARRWRLF